MRYRVYSICTCILVGFLAACSGSSSTPSEPEALLQTGGEATKAVCHEAQQKIDVLIKNLEEHLEHGDWLIGPEICDGEDNDCDGEIDNGIVCDGAD